MLLLKSVKNMSILLQILMMSKLWIERNSWSEASFPNCHCRHHPPTRFRPTFNNNPTLAAKTSLSIWEPTLVTVWDTLLTMPLIRAVQCGPPSTKRPNSMPRFHDLILTSRPCKSNTRAIRAIRCLDCCNDKRKTYPANPFVFTGWRAIRPLQNDCANWKITFGRCNRGRCSMCTSLQSPS